MYIFDTRERLLSSLSKLYDIVPPIQVKDVEFVGATVWLQGECNSRVTVRALPSSVDFTGSVSMNYNRWRVDEELRGLKIVAKPGDFTNTPQVLAVIRDTYGIPVYDTDFNNMSIGATDTGATLTPRPDALGWQPNFSVFIEYAET